MIFVLDIFVFFDHMHLMSGSKSGRVQTMEAEAGNGRGGFPNEDNRMGKIVDIWKTTPAGARITVLLLAAGWALHYVFYFLVFADEMPEKTTYLQLAVGIGICYGVATARKWARMLCVFFNLGIIALYALYSLALAQSGNIRLFALTALVVLLFSTSTLFLFRKDTASYFKPTEADTGHTQA
jgi:hypothetical protein